MRIRIALAMMAVFFAPKVHAQADRYDLGRRLRATELAWEAATPEHRAKAVDSLKRAVTFFLSNRHTDAAKVLDEARFCLQGRSEVSPAERWANSLIVRATQSLIDPSGEKLSVVARQGYEANGGVPKQTRIRLSLNGARKQKVLGEFAIDALPARGVVEITNVSPGDHVVVAEIIVDSKPLAKYEFGISIAPDWKSRLERLRAAARDLSTKPTTARNTLRAMTDMVSQLATRTMIETDLPAARFLCEGNELSRAIASGEQYYGPKRAGEFWLTLATASGSAPVRLLVPEGLQADRPVPLVIAMHGAGGSENMFFDIYGHGGTVKACKDRGWLMVSTRAVSVLGAAPPVGDIIDELSKMYPIDPKCIFVLGHSMGASHTISVVQASPGRFAAAAALGGGGSVRNAAALKGLPVYVACGSEDFALSSAKSLCGNLEKAGAKVTFKEYPHIEHLVIVQACMKEMFAFFDAIVREKN